MTFEEYCISKKIDPVKFQQFDSQRFAEWSTIFSEAGPESFTQQKLFLINPVRRLYKLENVVVASTSTDSVEKPTSAPKVGGFKPKFK